MSGLLNELVEIVGAEVGHADRPNTTLGKKLHRSPVGIDRCLDAIANSFQTFGPDARQR
jgi:hypothetical protein